MVPRSKLLVFVIVKICSNVLQIKRTQYKFGNWYKNIHIIITYNILINHSFNTNLTNRIRKLIL